MRFELFMARRYLLRGRGNSFLAVMSLASIIGIAIGVAALIIAMSLMNGFQNEIRDKILSSSAHLMIMDRFSDQLSEADEVRDFLAGHWPEIKSMRKVVFNTVLLRSAAGNAAGAVLRGVDLDNTDVEQWLLYPAFGSAPGPGQVMIGLDLAAKLNLLEGDSVYLITPQFSLAPSGVLPRFKKYLVSGLFRSGLYEFDSATVIIPLAEAQQLFRLEDRISYLRVDLKDMFAAPRLAAEISERRPGRFHLVTWMEMNAPLYSALKLEKTVLFFTLTLIIVVAALNIIAGLILLVYQKIRDIAILLSYGVQDKTIKRIFFVQGGFIGLIGTLSGGFLGVVFCLLANRFKLIRVPAEIYQMSYVPFTLSLTDVLAVIGVALAICLAATWIPARRAAAVNVVEAVKYE